MERERKTTIAVYDTPISKPTGEIPEEFVRLVESRFVTKRFPKPQTSQFNRHPQRNGGN